MREGAGKAGPRLRPVARLRKKCRRQVPQVQPDEPGLPCAMVLTAASRSPRCAGLVGHRLRMLLSHQRDLSVGRSGPRDLTVRIELARRPANAKPQIRCVHRSPLLRLVTIGRNVPLHRGGISEIIVVICPTWQGQGRATDWHDGQFAQGGHAEHARRADDCTGCGSQHRGPPRRSEAAILPDCFGCPSRSNGKKPRALIADGASKS